MNKEKIYEDLTLVRRRARTVFWVLAGLAVFVLATYWKTQILDHDRFWKMAEANRIRERFLPAPRGLILDRRDVILADNTAGFRVSLLRENARDLDALCAALAPLLDTEAAVIRERLARYAGQPAFEPVVVKDNLTVEQVARIESRRPEFPEVLVEAEPRRSYPYGNHAAHVLGYLQELTPEELGPDSPPGRHWGDLAGKTGLEKQYDALLTGQAGTLFEIVDNLGRSRGEVSRRDPVMGRNVSLALDFELQKRAEELLAGREGSIVVLDPRNGEVLALASFPTFDPNGFISRFTPQEWLSLVNDPSFPLENRAIRGLYSPGSLFKPVMALAGLDSGLVDAGTTVYCSGGTVIYGTPRGCWFKPGHGAMNVVSAIQNSCNIYFYSLGRRMSVDEISRYAGLAGLGRRTGIDIPGEKEGLVPTEEWKKRVTKQPWYAGETISVAIGQGPLLVTPLQAACVTAYLANRGSRIVPRLLRDPLREAAPPERGPLSKALFEPVIEGMWRSANAGGTSKAAAVAGFDVCGKTGSTQVVSTERAEQLARQGREIKTHSWFSGFAPREAPRVVVTVLVEFGGGGGAAAAPLARELFDLYRKTYAR